MTNDNRRATGNEAFVDEQFWQTMLENVTAPTPFMIDGANVRKEDKEATVKEISAVLGPEVSALTQAYLQMIDVDRESFYVGLWAILLGRYSAEQQVVFAISGVSGLPALETVAPIRVEIRDIDKCSTWLQQIQLKVHDLLGRRVPPLDELHRLSDVDEHTPLLESLVTFCPSNGDYISMPLRLEVEFGNDLSLTVRYESPRFDDAVMKRLLGHLQVLIGAIVSQPDLPICQLPLLTGAEQQEILVDWNRSEIAYPDDKCLHDLFEEQVERTPDAIAIIFEGTQLTYRQLNEKANQLAVYLASKGAKTGQLVAIALNRDLNMPIAMLAVAKSGAAYVPLDPDYPADRLKFMLEDTEASILLTESSLSDRFSEFTNDRVLIDDDWPKIDKLDSLNLGTNVTPEDLAYVIYTSGSTGNPKGAVLNHQGRVNNFTDFNRRYNIGPGDRLLALASISFDMSVYDIFGTLMCGGCVVIADASNLAGADNWAHLMIKQDITVWHSVPALMEMLVDHVETREAIIPKKLRLVLLGGDWIPVALPDRLKRLVPDVHVVSMGGATEVSMDSTIYDIEDTSSNWKSIPYGFPMANQLTYILDRNLQPLPIGVPGELHLGGVGVGEGYWKREQLTAEKFIANPFRPGERLYKTGDLARFGEDGNLELLGRIDFQVKIRGFRVELGEIESTLRNHPEVRECVVLARADHNNNKRLVAYVLADDTIEGRDQSAQTLVEHWASVYDHAYSNTDNVAEPNIDPSFNIVSWDSSYTGKPYPDCVMQTWVDSTVQRIQRYKPRKVLEIGCGTGLLLFKIAPNCDEYHGTDISTVALQHVEQEREKLGLSHVTLENRKADDLSGLDAEKFDVIILNSIVMDFPDVEYLTEVLTGISRLVTPGGVVFVGDVRDLRTQKMFYTSVQLHQSRSAMTSAALKQSITQQLDMEEELLVDPGYFLALRNQVQNISDVEILMKRGRDDNEMTKFRYDVVLHVGKSTKNTTQFTKWESWQTDSYDLNKLSERLKKDPNDFVALEDIPNSRILADKIALELLEKSGDCKVFELRRAVRHEKESRAAVDPESIWTIARQLNRNVSIQYPRTGNSHCFDAVLCPENDDDNFQLTFDSRNFPHHGRLDEYTNDPLSAEKSRDLIRTIRCYLTGRLPNYMVPSAIIVLDKFPLSPNGKLNRRALPEPSNLRPELAGKYTAPATPIEKAISEIWCQCLSIDRAGLHDTFIELGGNSLLASQVVLRVRDIFPIEISLAQGLRSSLQEFSRFVEMAAAKSGLDAHEIASVYLEVMAMTDEDIELQLNS